MTYRASGMFEPRLLGRLVKLRWLGGYFVFGINGEFLLHIFQTIRVGCFGVCGTNSELPWDGEGEDRAARNSWVAGDGWSICLLSISPLVKAETCATAGFGSPSNIIASRAVMAAGFAFYVLGTRLGNSPRPILELSPAAAFPKSTSQLNTQKLT